jgi:ABC-2 type transport system ATP-binding protein
MPTITVENLQKSFGSTKAVQDVSFDVRPGEIFGLLGPNGSGKTTTIRMILDIYKPDNGRISILDGPMNEAKKDRIGYLPEERGLYQDIPVAVCLEYMATLKSLDKAVIAQRLPELLEKFDLTQHSKKKVKELSKGMQQKAQLIATLIHDPELIIIDEPFSALDPVNTQLVKDLLLEQRNKNKTVVMCTHQMNQVEQLCDRMVLIDKGKVMLYGGVNEIRNRYITDEVLVNVAGELPSTLKGIKEIRKENSQTRLVPETGYSSQSILADLIAAGVQINSFEKAVPSLDEIFIRVVKGEVYDEQNA